MADRQSLAVKIARLIQRVPLHYLRPVERALLPVFRNGDSGNLIVLLALPRSGSTLTYQCLIHSLEGRYLSNLGNMFCQLPFLGGMISNVKCWPHESDFKSVYGFVDGLCGPSEGMLFWKTWLGCGLDDREHCEFPDDELKNKLDYINKVFSVITKDNSPLVTGYLGHVLMVSKIREYFPDALFVRLHRDPVENAISILNGMRSSGKHWFSVVPKEALSYERSDDYLRASAQVYWLNQRLKNELEGANVYNLHYEDLCQDPNAEVQGLVNFFQEKGATFSKKKELPKDFLRPAREYGIDSDADSIKESIIDFEAKHGGIL